MEDRDTDNFSSGFREKHVQVERKYIASDANIDAHNSGQLSK